MSTSVNDFYVLSKRDMQTCEFLEKSFPDEFAVSGAMYHLQQAIENSLKLFFCCAVKNHRIHMIFAS